LPAPAAAGALPEVPILEVSTPQILAIRFMTIAVSLTGETPAAQVPNIPGKTH
jgi:hypothetical protein